MQQTDRVAVLATQLPATDRRALSQAWYSALHLAEREPRARSAPPRRAPPASAPPRSARTAAPDARAVVRPASAASAARAAGGVARRAAALAADRRAPASELGRRIERALVRRRGAPASFALAVAGGRIRLLVRSDGERTRVVALCAPALRERVERALAHARFALAARGVRTEPA